MSESNECNECNDADASLFDSGFQYDIPTSAKTTLDENRLLNIAERFRGLTNSEIFEAIEPDKLSYAIMAVNITMCLNISNMIRTANLCGASKFILFGRRKYDARGCVGAQNYTTIEKISAIPDTSIINFEKITSDETNNMLNVKIFIDYIRTNKYLPIFMEQDKYSRPATNLNIQNIILRGRTLRRIPLFIFGSEGYGIPRNLLDTRTQGEIDLSYTLELKQRGCIRSFNVANCCSIICYKVMEACDELIQ